MKSVLVYGGAGALGREVISQFNANGWHTVSLDLGENESRINGVWKGCEKVASRNVRVPRTQHWGEALQYVQEELDNVKFDIIYCAAGGWTGGAIGSEGLIASVDHMVSFNLHSAISCGVVAAKTLNPGGLLVFTGAAAVLSNAPTPSMIAYGVSKAATHQLVSSLAQDGSGLPKGVCVVALCPVTLDTAPNRKAMPAADFSSWTPLSFVAKTVSEWAEHPHTRPPNGTLHKLVTVGGVTHLEKQ